LSFKVEKEPTPQLPKSNEKQKEREEEKAAPRIEPQRGSFFERVKENMVLDRWCRLQETRPSSDCQSL
jgi:hypothetical protein